MKEALDEPRAVELETVHPAGIFAMGKKCDCCHAEEPLVVIRGLAGDLLLLLCGHCLLHRKTDNRIAALEREVASLVKGTK